MANNSNDQKTVVKNLSDHLSDRAKGANVQPGDSIEAKKRQKVALSSMNMNKTAAGTAQSRGGGAFSGVSNTIQGGATNIYSPHLSTDFLELPQNLTEQRSYYRHFYNNDPFVGQAIDLHTELPLSKLRLSLPQGKDPERNQKILNFFERMVDRVDLLQVLIDATREYYVIGEAFIFAEDSEVEVPEEIYYKKRHYITEDGDPEVEKVERENAEELEREYIQNHYEGWKDIQILPPDQVEIESFQFSDEDAVELIPDGQTREIIEQAQSGDPRAVEQAEKIPDEIEEYIAQGENIPLGTDPYNGSFVYHLTRKAPPYQTHGVSLLQRCLRALIFKDKLRQAQTSIASRAMTPKRLVYAEDLDVPQTEDLRDQVDQALLDPDFSIVTNYQVNWEEISASDRLLSLSSEYDEINKQIYAGLGVTRSMMTGEQAGSSDRVSIEVINTRYLLYRERLQQYVEEKLFRPVAKKKGFVEHDEFGNERVLYPNLSFTRMAIRDNRDTFDNLFNLYQKGSLSVSYILELFNLDPSEVRDRLHEDMFTVSDATFNEAVRSTLSEVGRKVTEQTDFVEKFTQYLSDVSQFDLTYEGEDDEGGRF